MTNTVYSDSYFRCSLQMESLGNYDVTVFPCNYILSLSAHRPLCVLILLLDEKMT